MLCTSQNRDEGHLGGKIPWEKIYAAQLGLLYPNFRIWLANVVVPGVQAGDRRFFIYDQADHFGFVIAKRTADERKLCTVYVDPASRGRGIASDLMLDAMDWLGTERPVITISEDRLVDFRPLVKRLDFSLTQVAQSYYRENIREFIFNGQLPIRRSFNLRSIDQSASASLQETHRMDSRVQLRALTQCYVQTLDELQSLQLP
jgi:GNAT superfamily N-acetyltransferase